MSNDVKHPKDLPRTSNVAANSLVMVTKFAANGQANLAAITLLNFANSISGLANTSSLTLGNVTVNSISTSANSTMLGTNSNTEIATTFAIKRYVDLKAPVSTGREVLTADRTYYVSTTGNDSSDGLTNGTAWLTLLHVWKYICQNIDLAGHTITIQVAAGRFEGFSTFGAVDTAPDNSFLNIYSPVGGGSIHFVGRSSGSPTIIYGSTNTDYASIDIEHTVTSLISFTDMTFDGVTVNAAIYAVSPCKILFNGSTKFINCPYPFYAGTYAIIYVNDNMTLDGSISILGYVDNFGILQFYIPVLTISSPITANPFLYCGLGGYLQWYCPSVVGTVTGKKFDINTNGLFKQYHTPPGSIAGTTATGGQVT